MAELEKKFNVLDINNNNSAKIKQSLNNEKIEGCSLREFIQSINAELPGNVRKLIYRAFLLITSQDFRSDNRIIVIKMSDWLTVLV